MSDTAQAASSSPNTGSDQSVSTTSLESNSSFEGSQEVSVDQVKAVEAQIDADPNLSKAEKAQAKKTLKSIKIKYNGKEIQEDLPFEIPDDPKAVEYMRKQLQMSKMAQSKSQELSNYQRDAFEFLEQLKKNPRKVLTDPNINVDLKKIAQEILEEEIENAKKSPEQLEKEKLQSELKAMKEEREKEREENQKREFERNQQQAYEKYENDIISALDTSDIPKNPYFVKRIADYLLIGLNNGLDVSATDVLPLVREEMHSDLNAMFSVMPEEVIESIIGKENLGRVRKKNLQKVKQAIPKPQIKDVGLKTQTEAAKDSAKKQSMKDFFGF